MEDETEEIMEGEEEMEEGLELGMTDAELKYFHELQAAKNANKINK